VLASFCLIGVPVKPLNHAFGKPSRTLRASSRREFAQRHRSWPSCERDQRGSALSLGLATSRPLHPGVMLATEGIKICGAMMRVTFGSSSR
jgi:hypothetical protein